MSLTAAPPLPLPFTHPTLLIIRRLPLSLTTHFLPPITPLFLSFTPLAVSSPLFLYYILSVYKVRGCLLPALLWFHVCYSFSSSYATNTCPPPPSPPPPPSSSLWLGGVQAAVTLAFLGSLCFPFAFTISNQQEPWPEPRTDVKATIARGTRHTDEGLDWCRCAVFCCSFVFIFIILWLYN